MARKPVTDTTSEIPATVSAEGIPASDAPVSDVPASDRPAFDVTTVEADCGGVDLSRSLLVRALAPRWRCGIEFGIHPRLLRPADVVLIAIREKITPDEVVRRLGADPVLSVQSIA